MVVVDFHSMISSAQVSQMRPEDAVRQLAYSHERLLRNLQYSQFNYGEENFNPKALENITSPIYAKIEDSDNNIAELKVEADNISARVDNNDTSIGELNITADTVSAIVSNIGSGDEVTAASLILAINGDTSGATLSADHINLTGYVTISSLDTPGQVEIDGGNITAGIITGVKFKTAESGRRMEFDTSGIYSYNGTEKEGIAIRNDDNFDKITFYVNGLDNGTLGYDDVYNKFAMYSYPPMEISCGNVIEIDANVYANINGRLGVNMTAPSGGMLFEFNPSYEFKVLETGIASFIWKDGQLLPGGSDVYDIGNSTWYWDYMYSDNFTNISDETVKTEIKDNLDIYEGIYHDVKPIKYKMTVGKGKNKTHIGYSAQDIERALVRHGLDVDDFAGLVKEENQDPATKEERPYVYGINYNEMSAMNTYEIQKVYQVIEDLIDWIEKLDNKITKHDKQNKLT